MAVNRDPILKRCRYLGISPTVVGINKESFRKPNANGRRKVSEYGLQLKEKQKLKFIYGVLEKQFYHYYEIATKWKVRQVLTSSFVLKQDLTTSSSEWVWLRQEEMQDRLLLTVISS